MIFIDRLKYWSVGHIKQSPALWPLFWELGRRAPFLLPHDKSYYGFRRFAKPGGGLFLDIGANNGITALGIHKLLPDYRIFSIEADPAHEAALARAKRHIPGFEYRIAGASDRVEDMTLHVPEVDGSLIHALASTDLEYLKISVARDFGEERAARAVYRSRKIRMMPLDDLGVPISSRSTSRAMNWPPSTASTRRCQARARSFCSNTPRPISLNTPSFSQRGDIAF